MVTVTVTVYSAGPGCMACRLTQRKLDESGIRYRVVDLTQPGNTAARAYVADALGYAQAPVCVVDQDAHQHWGGFRPDLIDALGAPAATSAAFPHTSRRLS